METCWKCGAPLSADEVGLNYKVINRGVTKFLCFNCLSAKFDTTIDNLKALIERFRAAGCSMFPPKTQRSITGNG
jgi:hypothetical protein